MIAIIKVKDGGWLLSGTFICAKILHFYVHFYAQNKSNLMSEQMKFSVDSSSRSKVIAIMRIHYGDWPPSCICTRENIILPNKINQI